MIIRSYQAADQTAVIALWDRCDLLRPWNDPVKDIKRKLTIQPELFMVGLQHERIIASVMAGYDGHRGWVNYLAVDPAHRGKGFAREMMTAVESALLAKGCPKINLQIRAENEAALAFYAKIGFKQDRVLSFGKRLIPDGPGSP